MRKILALATVLASPLFVACSAPTDMTMNRMQEDTDPNYPTGPYGYVEGSTVENYKFSGKEPQNGDYVDMPMRDLRLGEFHADASAKLLLVEGSANWCYFCNQEAPKIESLAATYKDQGYRSLTVLAEGSVRGTPSTPDDIADWTARHDYKVSGMAIDPEARLFAYAPASAFPLHILLDTKTMKIQWLCVGGEGACDTEAAVADALGKL